MLKPMSRPNYATLSRIPPRVGVALKPEHAPEIFAGGHDLAFFEIHAENYMSDGGAPHALLSGVRNRFPLSIHGVGLSIGGSDPLDRAHLHRLQHLISVYRPGLFSEHLAWSSHGGNYLNDLLPLPYTKATLQRVIAHVGQVQNVLGIQMLLENPSTYVAFEESTMGEVEFLAEVVGRTGCGLLLDVNNVHVSAVNNRFDAFAYLDDFPIGSVGEIHLGGFGEDRDLDGAPLLIDSHGTPVADPVWRLYEHIIARSGPLPTLIEWDNDVPGLQVLTAEAVQAARVLERHGGPELRHAG
jgi:uncharacterized protein (UPF0276 family)